ncbi:MULTISPECIES: glycosyl hydrolase family 95 catalytic domain-containing protein [unclassified Paraflavitalea]|uniref:glycosyl hydrolase family 95 catalytic domain-containing protein n=1 Tax=unclassified Paraflavitalea TaxID=2798305 RepID=UPI003D33E498
MKKTVLGSLFVLVCFCASAQLKPSHDFKFSDLPTRWDDGMPMGNGWIGALVWKKGDKLRMSLDRIDLWDDRPMPKINKLKFSWVQQQVLKGKYDTVQKLGDDPYEASPAPTKIPGAALEFDLNPFGTVKEVSLSLKDGLLTIRFSNGIIMHQYVHAMRNTGYFSIEQLPKTIDPEQFMKQLKPALQMPNYNTGKKGAGGSSVEGLGLEQLGYAKGNIQQLQESILYHQPTRGTDYYEVAVNWKYSKQGSIIGQWTISKNKKAELPPLDLRTKEPTYWDTHIEWWNQFWSKSFISIPDPLIETQYYREQYKFACVARATTPPIALQAIWTADNGNLPPWKGDFHHDLNTQLSYWPGYTSNHLELTQGYTSWLWKIKAENLRWTKQYFGMNGLAVPGVTTISGKEMGGWIQYSMSPTTVAWVAQHFYWQWVYTQDTAFLKDRAFPYIKEATVFLLSKLKQDKQQGFIISSSPEYHDNSIKAWFRSYTNYDKSLYKYAIQLQLQLQRSFPQYKNLHLPEALLEEGLKQVGDFDVNETGLTIANGQNLDASHRHHAQLMAIYPMMQLDALNEKDKKVIDASLTQIEKIGTRAWCGYSFSWMACIYARAFDAEKALEQLRIFSTNFCAPNSFHLNGDQKGGQYSSFTYRPFTLEGNFAFAQGVHELLLQCKNGMIHVFPALPASWKEVAFENLIAEGGYRVDASIKNRKITVTVTSKTTGKMKLLLPPAQYQTKGVTFQSEPLGNWLLVTVDAKKGGTYTFIGN